MKMPEDIRIWIGGGLAATLVLGAAGWLLLVSPELSTIPAQHVQADSARLANAALQANVTSLRERSARMSALVAELRAVRDELPINADLPAVIDQLDAQAGHAKVSITSLAIGGVTSVAGAAAGSAADTAGAAGTDPSSTPTVSATATTSADGAATATGSAGTGAAAGPAGQLFQIQLTLITSGPLTAQEAFLRAVQYGGARAALVTSTHLGAGQTSESSAVGVASSLTTQLDVFVAPQTPAVAEALTRQLRAGSTDSGSTN